MADESKLATLHDVAIMLDEELTSIMGYAYNFEISDIINVLRSCYYISGYVTSDEMAISYGKVYERSPWYLLSNIYGLYYNDINIGDFGYPCYFPMDVLNGPYSFLKPNEPITDLDKCGVISEIKVPILYKTLVSFNVYIGDETTWFCDNDTDYWCNEIDVKSIDITIYNTDEGGDTIIYSNEFGTEDKYVDTGNELMYWRGGTETPFYIIFNEEKEMQVGITIHINTDFNGKLCYLKYNDEIFWFNDDSYGTYVHVDLSIPCQKKNESMVYDFSFYLNRQKPKTNTLTYENEGLTAEYPVASDVTFSARNSGYYTVYDEIYDPEIGDWVQTGTEVDFNDEGFSIILRKGETFSSEKIDIIDYSVKDGYTKFNDTSYNIYPEEDDTYSYVLEM